MNIEVGDWVRFYQMGQFTIAEVRYIKRTPHRDQVIYCTEQGKQHEDDILEVRRREQETP